MVRCHQIMPRQLDFASVPNSKRGNGTQTITQASAISKLSQLDGSIRSIRKLEPSLTRCDDGEQIKKSYVCLFACFWWFGLCVCVSACVMCVCLCGVIECWHLRNNAVRHAFTAFNWLSFTLSLPASSWASSIEHRITANSTRSITISLYACVNYKLVSTQHVYSVQQQRHHNNNKLLTWTCTFNTCILYLHST